MVAVPTDTPVTTPELLTVAIEGVLDDQSRAWSTPASALTDAATVPLPPTKTCAAGGVRVMKCTAGRTIGTLTDAEAALFTRDVAVMVAVPADTPVTTPALLTVATAGAADAQSRVLSAPASPVTAAVTV